MADSARPKIADYPFTTLVPQLGVVALVGGRSFVMADVPGLLEGAHAGHGLGDRFLRHLARTRALLHVLDAEPQGRDPLADYDVVRRELALHDPALAALPEIVAVSKMDRPEVAERAGELERRLGERGIALHRTSGATGMGTAEILEDLWKLIGREAHES